MTRVGDQLRVVSITDGKVMVQTNSGAEFEWIPDTEAHRTEVIRLFKQGKTLIFTVKNVAKSN